MDVERPDPSAPFEAIHAAERSLRRRVEAARAEAEARVAQAREEALRRTGEALCRVDEVEEAVREAALADAEAQAGRIRDEAEAVAQALAVAAAPRIPALVAHAVASILGEVPC